MVHIFCVEGNIAAGKSTLLRQLSELDNEILVIPERVTTWQGHGTGINLLQRFYDSPESNAFPFQLMVLHTRIHDITKAIQSAKDDTIIVVERSLQSDKIFAEQNRRLGRISELEWLVYELMVKESSQLINVKGRVLLQSPVDVLQKRLEKRGRCEENAIDVGYLADLNTAHTVRFATLPNVLQICNEDVFETAKKVMQWIKETVGI
jgi:deoxyadenosine/deoxycytidine kinase